MASKLLISVEEYLRTSFDGPDCDYVNGEVISRNIGELPQSDVQTQLAFLLKSREQKLGIRVQVEIRIQITPYRFRVADIAVWKSADLVGERVPTKAPLLVIEIVSAEDRLSRLLDRIDDYLSIGTPAIWLIDPAAREARLFNEAHPRGVAVDVLTLDTPELSIPLTDAFARLD